MGKFDESDRFLNNKIKRKIRCPIHSQRCAKNAVRSFEEEIVRILKNLIQHDHFDLSSTTEAR